jgi:transcriptional regulator with XRE-family HTH domain
VEVAQLAKRKLTWRDVVFRKVKLVNSDEATIQEIIDQLMYRGYTQRQIVEMTGLSPEEVAYYWHGNARPVVTVGERLERARERDIARVEELIEIYHRKALEGDVRAAKVVLDLLQHRATLLGLDKQNLTKNQEKEWLTMFDKVDGGLEEASA